MAPKAEQIIRVVLADDHRLILKGLGRLIEEADDIKVIGQTDRGEDVLSLVLGHEPDVLVLDVSMPDKGGIQVARQLKAAGQRTRIVFLSAHENKVFVREALSAGGCAYVLKRSLGDALIQAIRVAASGGTYVDVATNEEDVGKTPSVPDTTKIHCSAANVLTGREREVVRLVAFGFTNKEVAARLGVTSKSVETYKARASEKLNIRSRTKIVQYAFLQGWLQELPG
jgi:DNA-binding NarL/FixJ family response regulator